MKLSTQDLHDLISTTLSSGSFLRLGDSEIRQRTNVNIEDPETVVVFLYAILDWEHGIIGSYSVSTYDVAGLDMWEIVDLVFDRRDKAMSSMKDEYDKVFWSA